MLMHQKIIRQSLLVLYLLISYDGVQGKTMLSKLEDLELEEQLKLLNKPSIKTIKSKYGDIYNCVDFYKQPTFDHPLLKNHNFHPQMKPTLARPKQNSSTSETSWSSRIWSKDGDCPFGTVPIKIITKEDLVRQRNMPPPEDVIIDTELTNTINNTSDSKGRYISSQAYKVDPTLYRDSKTRLFIHFQAGNKHCFNVLCPGFVLVNNEIPIDMAFDKISRRGERRTWEFRMFIDRDLVNGNWWPLLAKTYVKIGFWPQKIFTSLASFANNIEWGGVAYSPPGVPKPPMGSSFFPIAQSNYDAYCRGLSVLNDKGATIDVDETTIYVDDPKLYQVLDYPHAAPGKFQHWVFYGGPGESHQL
ncbi:protein neprosin-like isoform X2 [Lycium barbarum]|uniref:protein neprosin-like isoform X2 n=1 Tax=Lycium barbarum TaxID=112863 RepID=UPI00293E26BC|nr:protein neprosin-like isoform X2 [Lycium barbarum]